MGVAFAPEGLQELQDCDAIRQGCLMLARSARRSLRILTRDLEPAFYDNEAFLEAVRQVALSGHGVPVRILLVDADPVVRTGHRLVEMARLLSSLVQIRKIPEEYDVHPETYLLSDDKGYLLRCRPEEFRATAHLRDPRRVRLLGRRFEEIWALGAFHEELRRLYL